MLSAGQHVYKTNLSFCLRHSGRDDPWHVKKVNCNAMLKVILPTSDQSPGGSRYGCLYDYNLGQNKMEQKTPIPPPPKSRMKPREGQKRAIFPPLIWGGGEAGSRLSIYLFIHLFILFYFILFILSKRVAGCWDCSDFYIGKTKRRLHDRKTEHFRALTKNDPTSAIADHIRATGHNIKWDHFDILASGKTDYHCKIKESLLFQELKPALNH